MIVSRKMDSSSSNTYMHPYFDRILFREIFVKEQKSDERRCGIIYRQKGSHGFTWIIICFMGVHYITQELGTFY